MESYITWCHGLHLSNDRNGTICPVEHERWHTALNSSRLQSAAADRNSLACQGKVCPQWKALMSCRLHVDFSIIFFLMTWKIFCLLFWKITINQLDTWSSEKVLTLTDFTMDGRPHSVLRILLLWRRPRWSTRLSSTSTPITLGFMGLGYFCIAALVTVSQGWLQGRQTENNF